MNDQDKELVTLYGKGWKFPLEFTMPSLSGNTDTVAFSSLVMSGGNDNVLQSLALLFQTQPGERIMRPALGCDLQSAVFSNMSEETLAALRNRIAECVARYEPRAQGVTVDVREDTTKQGVLRIEVTCRLAGQMQHITGQLNVMDGTDGGAGTWVTS